MKVPQDTKNPTTGTTIRTRKNAILKETDRDTIIRQLEKKCRLSKIGRSRRQSYHSAVRKLSCQVTITKRNLRKLTINEHMKDTIDSSSFHGVSYIFDMGHSIQRTVWFFITITSCIYAMQKVYESTVNYFDYPFNTIRMRQYVGEMKFPAVSFCNLNDMRMSILNGTLVDKAILDEYSTGKSENVSSEQYKNATRFAAHILEEMLIDCEFNGEKCSGKNFSIFHWKQGDKCYTFNSGKPGYRNISVRGAGLKRSLTLTINLQHYDYYRNVMSSGVHLILHGQDETPVRIIGSIISPGYATYIQVVKEKVCI